MKYKESISQYRYVEETMHRLYLVRQGKMPDENSQNYSMRLQGDLDIAGKGLNIARANYLLALVGLKKGHEDGEESALLEFFAELVLRSRDNPSDSMAHFSAQMETAARWHADQAAKVQAIQNGDNLGKQKVIL
jgi:hypothetical protein